MKRHTFNKLLATAIVSGSLFAPVVPASADDHRVTISNNTGFTMVGFYASHSGANAWQSNLLGNNALPTGQSVKLSLNGGANDCVFDFKAVFDDGDEVESDDNNVCEMDRYTYNP